MTDFWCDCGYHLLTATGEGRLGVTDDFLRAYFRRPEVRPVAESCAAERALHQALLDDPRAAVAEARLATLADPDARETYGIVLAFRDRLVAAGTVEGCYLGCFTQAGAVPVPPLFLDQMVHVILRHILDGTEEPLRARAAELFFRAQTVTVEEGAVMAADADTVELHATHEPAEELLAPGTPPLRSIELDVLEDRNAHLYWGRDQAHDTVLDLSFAKGGLDALCRVIEAWVRHFLAVEVAVQPVQKIRDERWVWHVGLDTEASAILNDLYNGVEVEAPRLSRLVSLFRLEFLDPGVMAPAVADRPVYLGLAVNEAGHLRLKPQNLLVNLPLARPA
jgi:hypothetical protein